MNNVTKAGLLSKRRFWVLI